MRSLSVAFCLTALLAVSCAPAGEMAGDLSAHRHAQLDVRYDIGDVGTLHVSGGPLYVGQEGTLTVIFIANQKIGTPHVAEDEVGNDNDNGNGNGNGNEFTQHPSLSLHVSGTVDVETDCDGGCKMYAESYISQVSDNGRHIQISDMEIGDRLTLYLKVIADESFKLAPRLIVNNITETAPAQTIEVHHRTSAKSSASSDTDKKQEDNNEPSSLPLALEAIGRSKSKLSNRVAPLFSGGGAYAFESTIQGEQGEDKNAYAVIDWEKLRVDTASKVQITFIAGDDMGGKRKWYNCQTTAKGCMYDSHGSDTVIRIKFPRNGGYTLARTAPFERGGVITRGSWEDNYQTYRAVMSKMDVYDHFTLSFTVTPLTTVDKNFVVEAEVTEGRNVNRRVVHYSIPIAANPNVHETTLGDKFRLKFSKNSGAGFKVSVVAMRDVSDRDNEMQIYCGLKCTHTDTLNSQHIKNLHLDRGQIKQGGYVYKLNINNSMKAGNAFTLIFGTIWSDTNITYYYPKVEYWSDKDNRNNSLYQVSPLGLSFR
ncbi:MAG: hypothetical protein OYH77_03755 [Pseudomonadota bacterium]|nr:hypothetical protein [Pseudomonadota bacterium]